MQKKFNKFVLAAVGAALIAPLSPMAYADPPPWAPAHGWRKKHDPYYKGYSGREWERDYGIVYGRCNREAIGTVLGGAVGGAVGATVGKGDDRTVAIIIGSVLGAVVGNRIGKQMDDTDRACIGHALELAADNKTVRWTGANNLYYELTPLRSVKRDGTNCREYRLHVNGRDGDTNRVERACTTGDGRWEPWRQERDAGAYRDDRDYRDNRDYRDLR